MSRRIRTSEEKEKKETGRWSLGTGTTSRSFEVESWSYVQHEDYQLHLLEKIDKESKLRPVIPTTEGQRLTYFRGYTTSAFKTQIAFLRYKTYKIFRALIVDSHVVLAENLSHSVNSDFSPVRWAWMVGMLPLLLGTFYAVFKYIVRDKQVPTSSDGLTLNVFKSI